MVGLPRALLTTVVYAVALLRTCFSACGSALHRGAQPQRVVEGDASRTKRNEVRRLQQCHAPPAAVSQGCVLPHTEWR